MFLRLCLLHPFDFEDMKARRGKRSEVCACLKHSLTSHGKNIAAFFIGTCELSSNLVLFQACWPSLVMKKWLNIKPKVYDFSEDEVDTESEDDGKLISYHQFCNISFCQKGVIVIFWPLFSYFSSLVLHFRCSLLCQRFKSAHT